MRVIGRTASSGPYVAVSVAVSVRVADGSVIRCAKNLRSCEVAAVASASTLQDVEAVS